MKVYAVRLGHRTYRIVALTIERAIILAKKRWIEGLDATEKHLEAKVEEIIESAELVCHIDAIDA